MKQKFPLGAILLIPGLFAACSSPKFIGLMTWEEYLELRQEPSD